jgi:RNA polymerase sigma factor (sigma-70 family)
MSDRDAEDDALLAAGRHAELMAAHYPAIVERLRLRLPDADAYGAGHEVVNRLLAELGCGRRFGAPFRLVVHTVVAWKLRERLGEPGPDPLLVDPGSGEDPTAALGERAGLERTLAGLPPRPRSVLALRYLEGRGITEIAAALGTSREAVDHALLRGRPRLRELLRG